MCTVVCKNVLYLEFPFLVDIVIAKALTNGGIEEFLKKSHFWIK